MGKPTLEAQESPPFEKPSIEQVNTHVDLLRVDIRILSFPRVYPLSHTNRGWTILSSTSSATCRLRNVKQSWSWLRCSSTKSTTGSWRRPRRDARGFLPMTPLDTKPTTPGSGLSTHPANVQYTWLHSHSLTLSFSCQMAVLLQRAPVLRQPAPVRDHADLRPDAAALGVHRDEEATARAGPAGKGQAATWETHTHSHTLSQVRKKRKAAPEIYHRGNVQHI